jgi:peptide deformylase
MEVMSAEAHPNPLTLLTRGNPVLARRSDPVTDILSPEFQDFLDDLIRSGEEHMGVGIAAPQVGKSLRAFILAPKPSQRYPDSPSMEPTPIVNPEILESFGPQEKDWEGCLSVPGFRGKVPRAHGVHVRFLDRAGRAHELTLEGFVARIFQHELDHLDGILYPQRMDPEDKLLDLEEFFAETGIRVPR